MHDYRVKFYFSNSSKIVDVTMHNREETWEGICRWITQTPFRAFVDQDGTGCIIVNLANVTKIEVEEVTP